jgi:hypothetical protein
MAVKLNTGPEWNASGEGMKVKRRVETVQIVSAAWEHGLGRSYSRVERWEARMNERGGTVMTNKSQQEE